MKYPVLMLLMGSLCVNAQQTNSDGPKALPITLSSVVLSRACTPNIVNRRPAPDSEFLTTDPVVCIFFEYNGGHKGDKIRVDWLNPPGNRSAFRSLRTT